MYSYIKLSKDELDTDIKSTRMFNGDQFNFGLFTTTFD